MLKIFFVLSLILNALFSMYVLKPKEALSLAYLTAKECSEPSKSEIDEIDLLLNQIQEASKITRIQLFDQVLAVKNATEEAGCKQFNVVGALRTFVKTESKANLTNFLTGLAMFTCPEIVNHLPKSP